MKELKTTDLKPGMVIKISQKIKEKDAKGNDKERIQAFEGTIIAIKGGKKNGATFTVRKIGANNVGVEKIFPLYLPSLEKIELVKELKVRRAKLYYLRDYNKKIKEKK
jgi:large subunit ribosomal protein L19